MPKVFIDLYTNVYMRWKYLCETSKIKCFVRLLCLNLCMDYFYFRRCKINSIGSAGTVMRCSAMSTRCCFLGCTSKCCSIWWETENKVHLRKPLETARKPLLCYLQRLPLIVWLIFGFQQFSCPRKTANQMQMAVKRSGWTHLGSRCHLSATCLGERRLAVENTQGFSRSSTGTWERVPGKWKRNFWSWTQLC